MYFRNSPFSIKGHKFVNYHPSLIICNTGGPHSRTREENISSTILGNSLKKIIMPRHSKVGIIFPAGILDIVQFMHDYMNKAGYNSTEDLGKKFQGPKNLMTCIDGQEKKGLPRINNKGEQKKVIRNAVILGMCNKFIYNPDSPIIWTRKRLTRIISLFGAGDFYELD